MRAFVLQTGGVQRRPPCRPLRCLSGAEREEISRGWPLASRAGSSRSGWAGTLDGVAGAGQKRWPHHYRAQAADAAAFRRAQRPKAAKLVTQPRLRAVVEAKLALRWSPEQLAGWLPLAYLPIR